MGRFGTIMLAGFFLGPSAATPMGLALDLPPVVALIAVLVGVHASFLVALFATERLRAANARRRATRADDGPGARWGLFRWWRRWSLLGRLSRRHNWGNWGLTSRWRRRQLDSRSKDRSGARAVRRARVAARARAVLVRFGPVGFGLVGPALFGTWVSAALGTALGLARWRLLTWLVVGATVWTALLVLASSSLFGWLFA